jgi:outer membrane protein OmpA-like peptidoglycan-associated protein
MVRPRILFDEHAQNPTAMARHILLILCLAFSTLTVAATTQQELLVHFDKDESILTPAAMAGLDAFIISLPISGDYRFSVHGHTDSDGSIDYNEALSQARADAVMRYLIEHGVDADKVSIDRSGELDPLATNAHGEGMALNRRVQVTFVRHSYADTEELRRALMEGSVQHFNIDPTKAQVIKGTAGTQLIFMANSFMDANGRPVTDTVSLELTEALGLQAILAHQLSTRSGSRMLETGGMLKVAATDANGNELRLRADAPMEVAVPTDTREAGMELFLSNDGSDWTTTGTPLTTTTVTRWQEPRYPVYPDISFKWPKYREDQQGRPIKPVEPVLPKEPAAPRRESYVSARPWWAFLSPTKANEFMERRYTLALAKYNEQLARYEKKRAAFEAECTSFTDRLEQYEERLTDWKSLKAAEYDAWQEQTYRPARLRYDAMMAPLRAKHDSLVLNYQRNREASIQRYALRMDSTNTADMGGLNAYVFSTSRLGWINCDRFYDVPEEQKYSVIASAPKKTDAQVFLVFDRIRSMMMLNKDMTGNYASPRVARAEPATLFAYTVIDGRAHLCMRPVSPSTRPTLEFEPSSFAEIGELLRSLGSAGS